jgi:hypothetical protein
MEDDRLRYLLHFTGVSNFHRPAEAAEAWTNFSTSTRTRVNGMYGMYGTRGSSEIWLRKGKQKKDFSI